LALICRPDQTCHVFGMSNYISLSRSLSLSLSPSLYEEQNLQIENLTLGCRCATDMTTIPSWVLIIQNERQLLNMNKVYPHYQMRCYIKRLLLKSSFMGFKVWYILQLWRAILNSLISPSSRSGVTVKTET
jgi:hypothetical protein